MTARMLQDQSDLVARLETATDAEIDKEPAFLTFVCVQKGKQDDDEGDVDIEATEQQARGLLAGLSPTELDDLRDRFCSEQEVLLEGMERLRPKAIAIEVAIEQSLVPDEVELNRNIRASSHLMKLEERKVKMLERRQEARRRKEGRRQ